MNISTESERVYITGNKRHSLKWNGDSGQNTPGTLIRKRNFHCQEGERSQDRFNGV